jgi:hypothetical protein
MPSWHFRGSPHYLNAQAARLGVSQVLADRARFNSELHRVSILLGQLCERLHAAPANGDGRPKLGTVELAQVKGTLLQCEQELDKLHVTAAAAQAMIDEAHGAFALDVPQRLFRVASIADDIPSSADLKPIKRRPAKAE